MTHTEFTQLMISIGNTLKNLTDISQICLQEIEVLNQKMLEVEALLLNHKERIEELQKEVRAEYNPTKRKVYVQ